jgi:hypothetical protein
VIRRFVPLADISAASFDYRRDLVGFMETRTGAPEGDAAPKLPGVP